MARPPGYQWQPLGLDADPVPGDPQAIRAHAAHLTSVARTITGQVAAMHKIASDDTEQGQHAGTIRAEARRHAASLQAVAVRHARVSTLDEAVEVGDQVVTAERAASVSGRLSKFFGEIASAIDEIPAILDALARLFTAIARTFGDFSEGMRPLASAMVKDARETSAWSRIFSGGEEPAKYAVRMRMLLARFPDNPQIARLGAKFAGEMRALRVVVGCGVAVTAVSTAGNGGSPHTGQPTRLVSLGTSARGIASSRTRPLPCPPAQ